MNSTARRVLANPQRVRARNSRIEGAPSHVRWPDLEERWDQENAFADRAWRGESRDVEEHHGVADPHRDRIAFNLLDLCAERLPMFGRSIGTQDGEAFTPGSVSRPCPTRRPGPPLCRAPGRLANARSTVRLSYRTRCSERRRRLLRAPGSAHDRSCRTSARNARDFRDERASRARADS